MIVIPMAGLSSRFANAGYDLPKYMLPLEGRSIFVHAIGSFNALFSETRFMLICRDVADTPDFVRTECNAIGLNTAQVDLVVLSHETAGQAETVAVGLDALDAPDTEPLTIFNIDTFRPGFRYPDTFDHRAVDGYIEVFKGDGDHWSFVRPDPEGDHRAAQVAEKVRISNLCSTGLYQFRDVRTFRRLYAPVATADPVTLQGGERYIAPLYQAAIEAGMDIRYHLIAPDEVRFCGTPDEYEALRHAAGEA